MIYVIILFSESRWSFYWQVFVIILLIDLIILCDRYINIVFVIILSTDLVIIRFVIISFTE
jgi:hypothetical protein